MGSPVCVWGCFLHLGKQAAGRPRDNNCQTVCLWEMAAEEQANTQKGRNNGKMFHLPATRAEQMFNQTRIISGAGYAQR